MSRRLSELDKWLDKIELALSTNDHGNDYESVENLINKHVQLMNEIDAKRLTINETANKAIELQNLVQIKFSLLKIINFGLGL